MNKAEIVAQFENAKNNYILGLAAISLFANEKSYPILEESHCNLGQYSLTFDQVARLLRNQKDREIAVKEFRTMLLRALIKETFEIMKSYCAESNQKGLLTSEAWYQFARIIRNCISHNFRFEFNKYDKGLLPVVWKHRTIDLSMNGRHLELLFFGYVEAWELFSEMQSFVTSKLS